MATTSSSSGVRIALIGYGYWGPNYARVLSEIDGSSVVAICDAQPERLSRAVTRHPNIRPVSTVSDIFKSPDIDAVVISTPASTHHALALQALESGRHVLVEKPLALEIDHCQELAELAKENDRTLMVAHTFLYNPGVRKMRECMQSPAFGHVYYLHSTRTNLGPIRQDVNAVWDLAPHDISIFNYLLGESPVWASAIGSRALSNSREDVGFITLGYGSEIIGNIHVSWADPNKVREVVAVGSRQRLVFNDLDDLERVRIFEKGVAVGEQDPSTFGEFKLLVRDGDIISPKIEFSEPLKNQAIDFIAAVAHGHQPVSDTTTGIDVVRTLKAIETSMREHGRAVEVAPWKTVPQSS